MNIKTIQKLGGIALILGAVLLTIYSVAFTFLISLKIPSSLPVQMIQNPNWLWLAFTAFLGVLFMLFGFTAVYSKIQAKAGVSGLVGYIFIQVAYLLQAAKVTWEICLYPVIVGNAKAVVLFKNNILKTSALFVGFKTLASLTILIGIILFCTAIIRSKVFPQIGGLLVFLGALIYGLGPLVNTLFALTGIFIFAIGCLVLGRKLMVG